MKERNRICQEYLGVPSAVVIWNIVWEWKQHNQPQPGTAEILPRCLSNYLNISCNYAHTIKRYSFYGLWDDKKDDYFARVCNGHGRRAALWCLPRSVQKFKNTLCVPGPASRPEAGGKAAVRPEEESSSPARRAAGAARMLCARRAEASEDEVRATSGGGVDGRAGASLPRNTCQLSGCRGCAWTQCDQGRSVSPFW